MDLNFWKVNPYLPISIKKFAFKFNIANANMNSTNPPSSKKKKRNYFKNNLVCEVVAMILISK